MRISGGQYKGRRFDPGKNFRGRPTTDMAKESLFNILHNRVIFEEIKALDLFSGTGNISFELASRGCKDITLVESDYRHYRFILEVIAKLGEKHIKPVKGNVFTYIKNTEQTFNLVFADPPYEHPRITELPGMVLSCGILRAGGLFILEHPAGLTFSDQPGFEETRRYGNANFSFFSIPTAG